MSRGLRNNNPGNIRHSKDKWQGMRAEQTDKDFVQFVSMEYGYRAMIKMLQSYKRKWGCNTIKDMIYRWCPDGDGNNNSALYVKMVCEDLQVPSTFEIDVNDAGLMTIFVGAMSKVENGVEADLNVIRKAWDLI